MSLLIVFGSICLSSSILLYQGRTETVSMTLAYCTVLGSALASIFAILLMPFRDLSLPKDGISQPFQPPNSDSRSPEDALTLWQFMTVAWMSPLIALGTKRPLNDTDVWQLSHQFQHRNLRDAFSEIRGSVLRRVVIANGVDLAILSLLSLMVLLTGTKEPRQMSERSSS